MTISEIGYEMVYSNYEHKYKSEINNNSGKKESKEGEKKKAISKKNTRSVFE